MLKAREAVMAQMKRWAEKVAANIKPAEDHAEAVLHAQVREKIGNMKEGRIAFLQKHGTDPTVASALLAAPAFLSGLSEAELALLRTEVEKKYLSPEISRGQGQSRRGVTGNRTQPPRRASHDQARRWLGEANRAEMAMPAAKVA